ncbi:fumarate reductase iron-sulfur subunit [Xylanimonas oleitrophica]|uniref:Fumarate reductase iron-sulfur subunit n=1 Tax=Xylanimonas oleitrophica TaxID=2607479 RepID=A0A2W5WKI6_9MICO|nr:2Fe-2S iron-sulfur cluster-binding protein [Xylanimonas oleitrophica]PZR51710.1 fumarate reductase iron-sulfur subunit [Xylanimonas oleitrophica]
MSENPADGAPTVRVTVTRQEPGQEPRDETFEVPYTDRTSVLDALDWIKDHVDPSLTFRWSCRMAVCGSCGVMVNGRPVLGCETFVSGYRTSGITVGPLAHAEVQRDLVVDTDGFLDRLRSLSPWLVPGGEAATQSAPAAGSSPQGADADADADAGADAVADAGSVQGADAHVGGAPAAPVGVPALDLLAVHSQTPGEVDAYRGFAQCIDCMLCYAACPVLDAVPGFVGPAAIATARRWDTDSRDGGDALRMAAMAENEEGIWPCAQIGACTRACPKGVDPARAIRDAQRIAMGG